MNKDPYLTCVNFSRNDDYIPDRAMRQNFSINFLLHQLKTFKIPSEIILVEWNYPTDRPPLESTLNLKVSTPWTTIRIIRVPPQFHRKYRYWKHKAFHVGAAVNVGIRRAKGRFILPMASDVFFSDACMKTIAEQNLDESSFYRCDRFDVSSELLSEQICMQPFERARFFEQCDENFIRHHKEQLQEPAYGIPPLHTNASGDFCLVARSHYLQARGFKEGKDVGALDIDSLLLHALEGMGLRQCILPSECKVYKFFHQKSTVQALQEKWKPWQKRLELRLLRASKTTECINQYRAFFNYPKRQFSYAPKMMLDSFERNFLKPARRWAQKIPPYYLNGPNWGLSKYQLEEKVVNAS